MNHPIPRVFHLPHELLNFVIDVHFLIWVLVRKGPWGGVANSEAGRRELPVGHSGEAIPSILDHGCYYRHGGGDRQGGEVSYLLLGEGERPLPRYPVCVAVEVVEEEAVRLLEEVVQELEEVVALLPLLWLTPAAPLPPWACRWPNFSTCSRSSRSRVSRACKISCFVMPLRRSRCSKSICSMVKRGSSV